MNEGGGAPVSDGPVSDGENIFGPPDSNNDFDNVGQSQEEALDAMDWSAFEMDICED